MRQYLDALTEVLTKGTRKENRTGVDTLSTFNINYEIDLAGGFPLLTTKAVSWKNIVVENLWFLSGEKDVALLRRHGCRFWDAWADKVTGEVPSAYGNLWRNFPVHQIPERGELAAGVPHAAWNDQVAWVVDELRRNPMSRRLAVSAWAPAQAQSSGLPPCHMVFVLNVQTRAERQRPPRLCLHLTQRSCDIALGVPYNIAGYALLLELFARLGSTSSDPLEAGIFAHTLVDAHAYTRKPDGSMAEHDHVPGLREQLTREPRRLPRLTIDPALTKLSDLRDLLRAETHELLEVFKLRGYDPHPEIKFKVAV